MKVQTKLTLILAIEILILLIIITSFLGVFSSGEAFAGKPHRAEISEFEEIDYSKVYYYEKENQERYEAYQMENPGMQFEDIVWQVNAKVDIPFYEDIEVVNDPEALDVLLNKYNKLPENYAPADLASMQSGNQLRQAAYDAYDEMWTAAKNEGMHLMVKTAYRNQEMQNDIHNSYKDNESQEVADSYSSRPGHSEHEAGLAIDLQAARQGEGVQTFGSTPEAAWVAENAYKFGYIIRYPLGYEEITGYQYEPWHVRYVGKDVSQKMHDEGISTFEEYYVKYKEK